LSSVTSAAPVLSSPAGNMWSGCYNAGRAAAGRRARSSVGGRARQPHDQPRCAEMVALAVAPPPWRHILDDLPARSQVWRGAETQLRRAPRARRAAGRGAVPAWSRRSRSSGSRSAPQGAMGPRTSRSRPAEPPWVRGRRDL